jgi:hypothetical protein
MSVRPYSLEVCIAFGRATLLRKWTVLGENAANVRVLCRSVNIALLDAMGHVVGFGNAMECDFIDKP